MNTELQILTGSDTVTDRPTFLRSVILADGDDGSEVEIIEGDSEETKLVLTAPAGGSAVWNTGAPGPLLRGLDVEITGTATVTVEFS